MDSAARSGQRSIWSLWLAAAIAFIGGLLPLVFGGTSSRVEGVVLPFTIGAIGFAACALLNNQSRTMVSVVYFVAGLAVVFGILSMVSLPVRLAALGSCPIAPNPCTTGLPRALSDSENTGIASATAFGIVAVFVGFFGLVTIYRRAVTPAYTPPERKIPAVAPATPVQDTAPPAPQAKPEPEKEPEPEPELPAPEELPELPAHESNTAST
ncbi:MAG TPA: hypothetical protein VGX27_00585 [Candidatus Dormibacteraeota bacterium]|nr:hypothetical protein [Candidatus Dormibacteraeota bacterium]